MKRLSPIERTPECYEKGRGKSPKICALKIFVLELKISFHTN